MTDTHDLAMVQRLFPGSRIAARCHNDYETFRAQFYALLQEQFGALSGIDRLYAAVELRRDCVAHLNSLAHLESLAHDSLDLPPWQRTPWQRERAREWAARLWDDLGETISQYLAYIDKEVA